MEGPGVAPVKHKDIDRLADKFVEKRDAKAELASEMTKIEAQIAEKMVEHGISRYQFSDQEVVLKVGKTHIKVKSVKVDGFEIDPDDEP